MTTSEPTTGEIAGAIRVCENKLECDVCPMRDKPCGDLYTLAADRLESQEREIERLMVACETIYQENQAMIDCHKPNLDTIAALTARAEQAERERDELKETVIDYELAERGF